MLIAKGTAALQLTAFSTAPRSPPNGELRNVKLLAANSIHEMDPRKAPEYSGPRLR